MKNHEDSIFRKKGFFVALYACLGAVAVLAMVITFTNRIGNDPEVAPVGADQVLPYLEQARVEDYDEEAWFRPRATPTPSPAPTPVPQASPTPRPPATVTPLPTQVPQINDLPAGEIPSEVPVPGATPAPAPEAYEAPPAPAVVVPTFVPFNETDRMIWPVLGDIIMDFSPNVMAFNPTFGGFRTNDDIRIGAQEGTPVRAAADGRVTAIGSSVDYGNYVLVDHGNGWVARYGQLMDTMLVSVNEVVRTGQVIGGVGQPSYFGTMLGTHFNFRLTRDGQPVNPNNVLTER